MSLSRCHSPLIPWAAYGLAPLVPWPRIAQAREAGADREEEQGEHDSEEQATKARVDPIVEYDCAHLLHRLGWCQQLAARGSVREPPGMGKESDRWIPRQ